jgi:drug/metabolite transporter (DMT)-like permease
MPKRSRSIAYLLLSINTIFWGAALIIVKPAFAITSPLRFLFYRYLLASFLSLPFLIYYWPKVKNKFINIVRISANELLGTVFALTILYSGLTRTSALEASFLATLSPLFVILMGIFFLKEKEQKNEWFGLALAFLGTLMLIILPIISSSNNLISNISLTGNLLILGYSLSNAIYFILAKKHYQKLPKLFVASVSFVVGLVCFAILNLVNVGMSLPTISHLIATDLQNSSVILASVYMAVFGSIIGYTAYIKGQDMVEASEASLFWYLQPLIYLPLGILWLKESLSFIQVLALIIIFFGVFKAEKRQSR